MSGRTCAVGICKNNCKSSNLSFHRFPRDKKLRKIWVLKCRRKDKFNPDTSRICSVHFKPDEFERDLQAELLGSRPKAILKPNVVPTLNLTNGAIKSANDAKHKRMLKISAKEKHDKLLESASVMTSTTSEVSGNTDSVATSIPSLNLNPEKNIKLNPCDTKNTRLERAAKRKHKEFIKRILEAEKEQDVESENISESDNEEDDMSKRGVAKVDQTAETHNLELERKISEFISSTVQILFAELL